MTDLDWINQHVSPEMRGEYLEIARESGLTPDVLRKRLEKAAIPPGHYPTVFLRVHPLMWTYALHACREAFGDDFQNREFGRDQKFDFKLVETHQLRWGESFLAGPPKSQWHLSVIRFGSPLAVQFFGRVAVDQSLPEESRTPEKNLPAPSKQEVPVVDPGWLIV